MKKRKLLLIALCMTSVTACAYGITACNNDKTSEHEHTYSTTWSHDDDSHFHACTDEDCTAISDDTPHDMGEWETVTPATTDTKGQEKRECSVCDFVEYRDTEKLTPAPAHSHSWGAWTVTKAPTETEEGKATRTCSGSGECDGATSDKEHVLPVLTSEDYSKSEDTATCSAAGKITYTYNKGGVSVSFDVATPVNESAHKYGNYTYTDGTGHYKVCEHNPEHKTTAEPHDANGENGSCSVCGYKEEQTENPPAPVHTHDWGNWTVTEENKPTATAEGKATRTCSGSGECDAEAADKEHVLPALTSDDYTITDDTATVNGGGTGTYTYNQNGVSVSFTAATPALESVDFTITVTGAPAGVTVKLGKYSATTNSEGVATVKAEKEDYDVVIENDYIFTATKVTAANPTATVKLPAFITGNTSDRINSYGTITGAGLYTTTIIAKADEEVEDKFYPGERYFSLNISGEVKTYTVKILSDNTTIAPNEAGVNQFTGVGESYSVVLEDGDSTMFVITSNDNDVAVEYTYKVVFEIIESEAPEAGVYERPVRLENDVESTTEVSSATQKVYYRLDYATFGKNAEITFGEGVTVYSLGLSKSGEATEITSGEVITIGEYNPAYLYAVSTGESVTLTATVHYEYGMKEKPFDVTVGEENSPEFDIENGDYEQWYKLEVEEDGTYIVKPEATHAVLEVYNDVNGEAVKTASGGAAISVRLTANTPVYIKAKSSLNQTYSFTVTEFDDDDKGLSEAAPLELTVSGDYTAYDTHYYKVTADVNSKVVFTYNDGVESTTNRLNFWLYSDENYENFIEICRTNKYEKLAVAGETYYIKTTSSNATGTFHFEITALEAHDHVITVSGAEDCSGISVKVMNGNNEVASGTTQADGTVSLNFVPGEYKIVLENLPAGYGYFADYALTAVNDEQTSYIDVKVYALADYSLTVKLPDGTGAAGITVTFTNKVTGTFTAETDANGVAKITQLPPMTAKTDGTIATGGSYAVTFELPASLSEDYTYTGTAVSLTSTTPKKEVSLAGYLAYTFTFTDSEGGTLPEGTTITVKNGTKVVATLTTDAQGAAAMTEKVVAGEYTILIGTDVKYATFTKTSLTQAQTAVTYEEFTGVAGGAIAGSAKVITDSTQIYNASSAGYYKISGAGTYTVSVDSDMQIYYLYLNNWTSSACVMTGNTITASRNKISLTIVEKDSSGAATKISFTLSDTDYVIIGVKGTGFANVTIEHSDPK